MYSGAEQPKISIKNSAQQQKKENHSGPAARAISFRSHDQQPQKRTTYVSYTRENAARAPASNKKTIF